MAQLFDGNGYRDGSIGSDDSQLPALETLAPAGSGEKEKAAFILRLLRQAASENREAKSQGFYSIRAVARHFGVPPTTVTRVYDKLKEEGVLASIWGSKTFIEPREINRNIRVKARIGLPASLRLFAAVRNYRMFFVAMQDMLWKHGFATRLLFYEGTELETPNLADLLLDYKVDVVIWFWPNFRSTNTTARLVDHGVRLVPIIDAVPRNGDCGFYINRRSAVSEALAFWKRSGIKFVTILHRNGHDSLTRLTMIEGCLREISLPYTVSRIEPSAEAISAYPVQRGKHAVILATSDTALELASEGATQFSDFLREHRTMFVEGAIDLPNGQPLNGENDLIEVNWMAATRRIGNNLIKSTRSHPNEQIIFAANWVSRALK